MAEKKTAPKKTKPAVKKVSPATEQESAVIDKIAQLQKDGYSVTLCCEGRNRQVKCGECVIDYIRAHKPVELVGMKSGAAAKVVQL